MSDANSLVPPKQDFFSPTVGHFVLERANLRVYPETV